MALITKYTPPTYSSMHGDLIYTVYNAANYQQPGYKYVCDVYINGVQVYRGKVFPNPVNNVGFFNIGSIVRSYISTQLNPITNNIRAQEFNTPDFYLDVVCKFGEEFSNALYTNLLIAPNCRAYNYYNGRIGDFPLLLSYQDTVITNRTLVNKVMLTDVFCFIPYFPTSNTGFPVQIKTYGTGGNLIATNTATVTPTAANYLQQLNVAPAAINALYPGMIGNSVSYYTVKFNNSAIYTFNIICEAKFTPFTLHFINQYGGFESYIFPKVSKFTYDIERKQYLQPAYRMDGNGIVTFGNSNNVLYDNTTTFASQFKENYKLTTDVLTDAEYTWLKELIISPIVYIQEGIYLVPVIITDSNYERKKFVNDKITALQVNIQFGQPYNTMFR